MAPKNNSAAFPVTVANFLLLDHMGDTGRVCVPARAIQSSTGLPTFFKPKIVVLGSQPTLLQIRLYFGPSEDALQYHNRDQTSLGNCESL